ncbi:hypothetical protein F0562_018882 [Nyssa sinensis]|uniref:peroxidase n=1 Tax=Nyssa sinensis TaxID=561372 RepID=A0A5J4ZDW6_9ASTE|nr:hypothetical protein F0562_018882 [Nyssa sinensis]
MLVSWITRTLDPKLAASIPFHDEAKRLWDYLEKRFCVANGPRLQQLRADITHCKQTSNMSIDDYYTRLMGLYDELDRLKPLHACACGKCTCDVAGRFAVDQEEEKLHQFLIGINDELYATVRSNLLSTSPFPDLDRVYQACLQEEKSRGIARDRADKEEIHAFALQTARPKARFTRPDKSKLYCSVCKRSGHDDNTCFKTHGYQDWWEDRNRGVQGSARPNQTPPPAAPPTIPRGRPKVVAATVVAANAVAGGRTDSVASAHGSSGISLPDLKPEQDLRSGSLIGAGERKDGLYYFRQIPTVCAVTVPEISDFELWHRRLGHPLDRVVKLVPAISSSTSRKKLDKACEVCPQAMQKRDIFVSRDVKFHENEFPYKTVSPSQVPAYSSSPPDSNVGIDVDCLEDLESALVDDHVAPPIGTDIVLNPTSPHVPPALLSPLASADDLGRGLRDKRPSVLLRDFVTHTVQSSSPFECSSSSTSSSENEEDPGLVMNFYKDSCPQAEDIIREQVKLLYKRHKNTAFSWLRNIFHDCGVQSCDASLLLDSTRRSLSEKETDRSFGLRNFRYLDTIKEAVERECPGVVSCADILVLSARDGIVSVTSFSFPFPPLLVSVFCMF